MPEVKLKDLFLGLQEELAAALHATRLGVPHANMKGDASELRWIETLEQYLPKRYAVAKACVLDAKGQLSEQIDIVVFDRQYCPFLFNHDGTCFIPAEAVYAIFEVKQAMNKGMIEYAGGKAASVRSLHRTSVAIPHAGGKFAPKTPFRIVAGIITLDSEWNPPLGDPMLETLCALSDDHRLDMGCALRHGAFEMSYPEEDAPQIEHSEQETALVFFFLRLMQRLQQLGTVPAIDLKAYGDNL